MRIVSTEHLGQVLSALPGAPRVVAGGNYDNLADWVHTGQALQRILLTASTCGAAVALHSQPLEVPWLREFIRTQLSDGAHPHLVLRTGLVTQVAISVRRDPEDVLFAAGISTHEGDWK
jgi:hypothetical protein